LCTVYRVYNAVYFVFITPYTVFYPVICIFGTVLCRCLLCYFQVSEALKRVLAPSDILYSANTNGSLPLPSNASSYISHSAVANGSLSLSSDVSSNATLDPVIEFHSLQYSIFMTCFVQVLGGLFFLLTALYITADRLHAERAIAGRRSFEQSERAVRCLSRVILERRSTGIMLFEYGPAPTDGRSGYAVFIGGMLHTVWDFSNCNVSCVFGHAHRCYDHLVCVHVVLSGVTIQCVLNVAVRLGYSTYIWLSVSNLPLQCAVV
jgi:hypothetical protein